LGRCGSSGHFLIPDSRHIKGTYTHTEPSAAITWAVVRLLMDAFDEQDPRQLGNVLRVSNNGKVLLYERDLGLRNRIFRFVYYVEPRGYRGDHHDEH
jgi:hypothetical protein